MYIYICIYIYIYFFCVDFTRCMKIVLQYELYSLDRSTWKDLFIRWGKATAWFYYSEGNESVGMFTTMHTHNWFCFVQSCCCFLVYKFMHWNSFVHIVSYRHWVSYWKFKDKEEQKMNSLGITLRFPKYHTWAFPWHHTLEKVASHKLQTKFHSN